MYFQPSNIEVVELKCFLLPNGQIVTKGREIGTYEELKDDLKIFNE